MKCISNIKIDKKLVSNYIDKRLINNRIARLARKKQREDIQELFREGAKAEKVIFEKLKNNIPKNSLQSIIDNNITDKYSTMDFTYYIDKLPVTDIEHKYRIKYKHDYFYNGLMYGKNKFEYGVKRLKQGVTHKVYWTCSDGIYFWELYDLEVQKDEYSFGPNCNKNINQDKKDMVYVKCNYLQKCNYVL